MQRGLRRTPYLLDALCSPGRGQIGNTLLQQFSEQQFGVADSRGSSYGPSFNGNEGGWYARIGGVRNSNGQIETVACVVKHLTPFPVHRLRSPPTGSAVSMKSSCPTMLPSIGAPW